MNCRKVHEHVFSWSPLKEFAGVGSIKRLRAHWLKMEMLAMGGGGGGEGERKMFWSYHTEWTFWTTFIFKTSKFPNKKGTFNVNIIFTATLACTKRALFHHKKGHFWSFQKSMQSQCTVNLLAKEIIVILSISFSVRYFAKFQSANNCNNGPIKTF